MAPRFASVGGGYDALLAPPIRQPRLALPVDHRRCSSVTCSSTGSSYLERRGSAMVMPCLPPPPSFPRHATYDEPWDLYYPIDIQVDLISTIANLPFFRDDLMASLFDDPLLDRGLKNKLHSRPISFLGLSIIFICLLTIQLAIVAITNFLFLKYKLKRN